MTADNSTGTTAKAVPANQRGLTPWKPGQSGNPSGLPKIDKELAAAARDLTPQILERLEHWLMSDSYKASLGAAAILLDRGYGKPVQFISDDTAVRSLAEEFGIAPEQVRRDLAERRKHVQAV